MGYSEIILKKEAGVDTMKKMLSVLLSAVLLIGLLSTAVMAAENESFRFELSIDGSDTKEVKTGDVITVVLRLMRTDANESYTMYAMQDEIRYDSTFFELVEGSAVLSSGIETTDIGMRDNFREFYMNYLSTSGGSTWEADTLVGSFQLRVIAESGVTKITNEDYLVSLSDGSGNYYSEGNELSVILSTTCTVRFESNGGTNLADQTVQYGETIVKPADPTRDGYTFDGWYSDLDRTTLWDFDSDKVTGNITLYAGWQSVAATPSMPEEPHDTSGHHLMWWILGFAALLLVLLAFFLPRRKVTFHTMGGPEIKARTVRKNGKISLPKPPRCYQKVFAGWYRDEACTQPWDPERDKVTENITLYARWM